MRQLNPLSATQRIHESYARYLKTLYLIKDLELGDQFSRLIDDEKLLIKGPYLESTPPYRTGNSIRELIRESVLSPLFSSLEGGSLPLDRKLYLHQEQAIRKLVTGRNLIVATGTGSGKTEAFLIPILHHLLEEKRRGQLSAGVRALLLYPMNALANDQMKRLRAILKDCPFITFGRYTGETKKTKREAKDDFERNLRGEPRIENERLSRKEMHDDPPHILLTNYAMLEYLLLRPEDSDFFDGPLARFWKFLVLDEVHTYDGAKGIETALLLRRLKDRIVSSERERIQCVGTSATLGGGKKDFPAVARFGTQLFDEPFHWEDQDPNKQDVVEASRLEPDDYDPCWGAYRPDFYRAILPLVESDESNDEQIARLAREYGAPEDVIDHAELLRGSKQRLLHELLKGDKNLEALRRELSGDGSGAKALLLRDMAKMLFSGVEDNEATLTALVSLAVQAKPEEEHVALLPARYHLFVKALEGGFVAFAPEKRLFLNRKEYLENHEAVFEMGICKRCGAVHLVGVTKDGRLAQSQKLTEENQEKAKFFLLKEQSIDASDEDEDIAENEAPTEDKDEAWQLCLRCGAIGEQGARDALCSCGGEWAKTVLKVSNDNGVVTRCRSCGARSRNLVHRFLTGQDAPGSVLATSLFQEIPEREVEQSAGEDDQYGESHFGQKMSRRLLIFSDSRQDAAYFAPYLGEISYLPILWRRLMILTLQKHHWECLQNRWTLSDLAKRLSREAVSRGIFAEESRQKREDEATRWLMLELVAQDRRNSLEGLGLAQFSLSKPKGWSPGKTLRDRLSAPPLDFSEDETWDLAQILADSFRLQSAIEFPDNISPEDELFSPRNRPYYFREQQASPKRGVYSWCTPRQGTLNRRLDFIQKLLRRCALGAESPETAQEILVLFFKNVFTHESSPLKRYFVEKDLPGEGTVRQARYDAWEVRPTFDSSVAKWYECDVCGNLFSRNLRDVCPTYRCDGTLKLCDPAQTKRDNHYRYLYLNLEPLRMVCREHTAQLTGAAAGELQNQFVRGEVNVISCSTTFELGVDVGSLESVLMRNVPPSPANYIQRAGRAGRRTDSTAFALTFCQRRPHDLSHFREPKRLISGTIRPPYFEVCNRKIISRHIHAVAMAMFWKQSPSSFGEVRDFFFSTARGMLKSSKEFFEAHLLREFVERRPLALRDALSRILKDQSADFEIENWGWLREFFFDDNAAFRRAADEVYGDVEELERLLIQLQAERKRSDHIIRTIETIYKRSLIDFLASRGVLPKYGFPVDVVELDLLHHGRDAERLELQRDLRIALSEYAPQSQVVAGGRLWTSHAIKRRHGRDWVLRRYAICGKCHCYQKAPLDTEELTICQTCEEPFVGRDKGRFIIPEFGFVSSSEPPRRATETRPERTYTTQVYYTGEDAQQGESLSVSYGDVQLRATAYSNGKFAVLNRAPFMVCFSCGFAQKAGRAAASHKSPRGGPCGGRLKGPYHLGHEFQTDLLRLDFIGQPTVPGFWLSLLYALLEGASASLSVLRSDLDGCLYPHRESPAPSLVLFDSVPGGAGHARRLVEKDAIQRMFTAAFRKVENCECGEETSCYGCLQNYQNQRYHDNLKRGLAREFLSACVQPR